MPKGKFAKEVKALSKNIKIIITSGLDLSAVDISRDGYDKFLLLPVKISTLVSTVKDMLDS